MRKKMTLTERKAAAAAVEIVEASRAGRDRRPVVSPGRVEYLAAVERTAADVARRAAILKVCADREWDVATVEARRRLDAAWTRSREAFENIGRLGYQRSESRFYRTQNISDVYRDVLALENEFDVVDFSASSIAVEWGPIILEDDDGGEHNMGRWRMWMPHNLSAYSLEVVSGENEGRGGYLHPHVASGTLCEGDGRERIDSAMKSLNILELFIVIRQVMASYSGGGSYLRLERWNAPNCQDCGCQITDDDIPSCQDCGRAICGGCEVQCAGGSCEEYRCSGCHDAECSYCDRSMCSDDCGRACAGEGCDVVYCGGYDCSGQLNGDDLCPSCEEEAEEAEAEAAEEAEAEELAEERRRLLEAEAASETAGGSLAGLEAAATVAEAAARAAWSRHYDRQTIARQAMADGWTADGRAATMGRQAGLLLVENQAAEALQAAEAAEAIAVEARRLTIAEADRQADNTAAAISLADAATRSGGGVTLEQLVGQVLGRPEAAADVNQEILGFLEE